MIIKERGKLLCNWERKLLRIEDCEREMVIKGKVMEDEDGDKIKRRESLNIIDKGKKMKIKIIERIEGKSRIVKRRKVWNNNKDIEMLRKEKKKMMRKDKRIEVDIIIKKKLENNKEEIEKWKKKWRVGDIVKDVEKIIEKKRIGRIEEKKKWLERLKEIKRIGGKEKNLKIKKEKLKSKGKNIGKGWRKSDRKEENGEGIIKKESKKSIEEISIEIMIVGKRMSGIDEDEKKKGRIEIEILKIEIKREVLMRNKEEMKKVGKKK